MSRPPKKRYVCCMPKHECFIPLNSPSDDIVVMSVDEYETIRLMDLEDYTQEDCALQMHIARTTVQKIYTQARKKLADALVNGKRLVISGGEYLLCDHYVKQCGRGCQKHCRRHTCPK